MEAIVEGFDCLYAGYANEQGHLWTPDGQLAALGYQVVAVYG